MAPSPPPPPSNTRRGQAAAAAAAAGSRSQSPVPSSARRTIRAAQTSTATTSPRQQQQRAGITRRMTTTNRIEQTEFMQDVGNMDDSSSSHQTGGFSPHTLLDRYSAEIDQTARNATANDAAAAADDDDVPTPMPSMFSRPQMSGGTGRAATQATQQRAQQQQPRTRNPTTARGTTSTSTATGPSIAMTTTGILASSASADLDTSDDYGRSKARGNRAATSTAAYFGKAERFERVDQSVNLMDVNAGEYSPPESSSRSSKVAAMNKRQAVHKNYARRQPSGTSPPRQGRLTAAQQRHAAGQGGPTSTSRFGRTISDATRRLSVFRTFSLTEVGLGDDSSDSNNIDSSNRMKKVDEEAEDGTGISGWACCQCCCMFIVIIVVVLLLVGVIPVPKTMFSDKAPHFDMGSLSTAEKSGEGINVGTNSSSSTNPTSTNSSNDSEDTSDGDDGRINQLQSFLIQSHINSKQDFDDELAIPSFALQWLATIEPVHWIDVDDNDMEEDEGVQLLLAERYALAVLFYSTHTQVGTEDENVQEELLEAALHHSQGILTTDGLSAKASAAIGQEIWTHKSGWMTSASVCEWYGIQCHREGRVKSLLLHLNNLQGPLPKELKALSMLEYFDVSENQLTSVPPILWESSTWPNLISIDLSFNTIQSILPESIGTRTALTILNVASNQMHGTLPTTLANLNALQVLNVQDNSFSGVIHDLSPIADLRVLLLDQNQLTGTFPFHLTQNRHLIELRLDRNHFQGTLPPELDSLHELKHFSASSNQFQGPIPDIFGRLSTALEELQLQSNRLGHHYYNEEEENAVASTLPTSLGLATNLKMLRLDSNGIQDKIPEQWWLGLKKLERFYMYDNALEGSLPSSIGNLSQLKDLQLHDNQMTGTVPTELGKCQMLETIKLYSNQFRGAIPDELCELRQDHDESSSSSASASSFMDVTSGNKKLSLLKADCKSRVECSCCDSCF